MTDIATLKARYFLGAVDAASPTNPPVPATFDECKITPLIDALELQRGAGSRTGHGGHGTRCRVECGHFVLLHNWWLGLSGGDYKGMKGVGGSIADRPQREPLLPGWPADAARRPPAARASSSTS